MKKYILSLVISFIGIFSIANATNYTIVCPDGGGSEVQCTPAPVLTIEGETCLRKVSVSSTTEIVDTLGYGGSYSRDAFSNEQPNIDDEGIYYEFCFNDNYGTIDNLYIYNPGYMFGFTITLSDGQIDTEGGVGEGGVGEGNGILTNGTATFTPIINRIIEIAKEFIPYLIYISIGALAIQLLWSAVKMIINYLKGESTSTIDGREGMRNRRRWRRQQRRKKYDENYINYYNDNNYYYTNAKRKGYYYQRKRKNYKNYQG